MPWSEYHSLSLHFNRHSLPLATYCKPFDTLSLSCMFAGKTPAFYYLSMAMYHLLVFFSVNTCVCMWGVSVALSGDDKLQAWHIGGDFGRYNTIRGIPSARHILRSRCKICHRTPITQCISVSRSLMWLRVMQSILGVEGLLRLNSPGTSQQKHRGNTLAPLF